MARTKLVAGNWKMNGSRAANAERLRRIAEGAAAAPAEVLVCPPAVYLESAASMLAGGRVALGAQNLSEQEQPGAFTGELHGAMLKEVGCSHVIVGHSERRQLYGESDALVGRKAQAAQRCGLIPVICLGETLDEREGGRTETVLQRQLDAVLQTIGIAALGRAVIAYEPVWAIGTGRTATPAQAQAAHAFLRGALAGHDAKISDSVRILYGGSVKAANAAALFAEPDLDGALVGGASLDAAEFVAIVLAAQSSTNKR